MSDWRKPRRPVDANPLFPMDDTYVIKGDPTPIQRQRALDGTPHTRGGRYSFQPGTIEPVGDNQPSLYLNKGLKDESTVPGGSGTRRSTADKPHVDDTTPIQGQIRSSAHARVQENAERAAAGAYKPKQSQGPSKYKVSDEQRSKMGLKKSADEVVKAFLKGSYGASPSDAAASGVGTKEDDQLSESKKPKVDTRRARSAGKTAGRGVKTAARLAGKVAGAVASVVPTSGR